MKNLKIVIFVSLGLMLITPVLARAAGTVTDFQVTISINADTSIDVIEQITYDFGEEGRQEFVRGIATEYVRDGIIYDLRLSDISVMDETGEEYEFRVKNKDKYKLITVGDPDEPITGEKVYSIEYTARQAINLAEDRDTLYWNVTGYNWPVTVKQTKATVNLPQSVSVKASAPEYDPQNDNEILHSACYTGRAGSTNSCVSKRYVYSGPDIVSSLVFIDDKLQPGAGVAVMVELPKDIVKLPPLSVRIRETLSGKSIWLILPAGLMIILYFRRQRQIKKRRVAKYRRRVIRTAKRPVKKRPHITKPGT